MSKPQICVLLFFEGFNLLNLFIMTQTARLIQFINEYMDDKPLHALAKDELEELEREVKKNFNVWQVFEGTLEERTLKGHKEGKSVSEIVLFEKTDRETVLKIINGFEND